MYAKNVFVKISVVIRVVKDVYSYLSKGLKAVSKALKTVFTSILSDF
jgi:hypothetical protein